MCADIPFLSPFDHRATTQHNIQQHRSFKLDVREKTIAIAVLISLYIIPSSIPPFAPRSFLPALVVLYG